MKTIECFDVFEIKLQGKKEGILLQTIGLKENLSLNQNEK